MQISSLGVPDGAKIISNSEPVVGSPGLEALSPRIASIFARWSALEKQLDQVHTLITDDEDEARAAFDRLKGWDRRFEAIADAATERLPEACDLIKVVLRLVAIPAGKRNELAHMVWAVVEGWEDCLTLLSGDSQHIFAKHLVAAKKAGTNQISIEAGLIFKDSRIVSASDLDQLINELKIAQDRLDSLIFGYLCAPFIDQTGKKFQDYRDKLIADTEVNSRLASMAKARKQAEKAARRVPSEPEP